MQSSRFLQVFLLAFAFLSTSLLSQSKVLSVVAPVDESNLITLRGTVHALARPEFDRGAVLDDFPVRRMLVMLNRPPENEAALKRFLRELHTPGSTRFHQWLRPEEYGKQFGANEEAIGTVTTWLEAHGFSVARTTASKVLIEFSGTAGQVREALHTEIHQYEAAGKTFFANDREISIPIDVSRCIRNFAPLNTFPLASYLAPAGKANLKRGANGAPSFTLTENNAPFYALAPQDFATQYDLGPVYTSGTDGSGETIGIVGVTNVNLPLVDAYRELFGLPADHTQVVVDGEDPGDGLSPNVEAFLDLEVSGAVAPNATINFYIASGQPLEDPLALAALRAIEDDQASVLSLSYGQCEPLLGEAGNQLWAGLWEQAAAQGQTVLVASGDTGPGTCLGVTVGGPNGAEESFGPTANGLSSTPWNVSVGGTDFYYSDYATGGASIASLWNQTNDSNLGSLKATLPEQAWDDALGLNIVPYITVADGGAEAFLGPVPSPAGGGASSNCSQVTIGSNGLPSCIAGYSKPVWQQGPGVPGDGARDLPDVALFAANGPNLTAWPICAEPGDCISGATPQVTLVGGTSASTPAMAGIMTLINQKYGRQGQADYTLYALARQQSGFHDITIGTNDVLCMLGTPPPPFPPVPNCTVPYSNPYFPNLYSFGMYAAGVGYDQATGLGSIDANELISNWSKVVLLPTATTLQLSPTTITHGSAIAVTASVLGSGSGSGVPTGDLTLETSPASSMRGNTPIALANGAASASITTLPGGSYQVVAQYGGDGVYGASASSPVAVTVDPEQSVTTLAGVTTGATVPFGGRVILTATPTGQTSHSSGLATGSVTFTDGSTSATVPLNVNGVASWTPQLLALGSHSVTASYSGDASYSASSAGPLAFTVGQGTPLLTAGLLSGPPVLNCPPAGGACSQAFLAGSTVVVHALLSAANGNVPPTGTVTVTLGTLTQTVAVVADSYLTENQATAYVQLPNVPAGTFSLTATYSGDSNWNATSYTSKEQFTFVASSNVATSTTALTLSPSSVDSAGSVTFDVTVTASTDQFGTPLGAVFLIANGTYFAAVNLGVNGINTVSQTESASLTVPGNALPLGQLNVVAVYSGFNGVGPSVSSPVQLNVTASDFSLALASSSLTVTSGQTGTVPLLLGGPYGTGVPVSLACTPSSSLLACSVNPTSSMVNGSGQAMLTVVAGIPTKTAKLALVPPRDSHLRFAAGCGSVLAFGAVLIVPWPRRKWRVQSFVLLLAALLVVAGCGSGSTRTSQLNPTPPGTYGVLVTATANGVVHNVSLTVTVAGK